MLEDYTTSTLGHLGDLCRLGSILDILDDVDTLGHVGEVHGGQLGVDHSPINSHFE